MPIEPGSSGELRHAVRRYFDVALYLLVLTGFGSLASTGGLDAVTVVLVGGALLFRGVLLALRRDFSISDRAVNWLTLAYIGFYALDYLSLSGEFLRATVHLVLFVMTARIFSAHRNRDYYFLAAISFLMVLAAAILTVDSVFLFAFAAFMLSAVAAFILLEMKTSDEAATLHARPSGHEEERRSFTRSLSLASPVFVVAILAGASLIFFILPRISAGYLSAYAAGGDLTTGFSNRVQLGRIGQIQQSNAVVMHIQIEGDTVGAHDLRWRGVALSSFDGRSWSNPFDQVVVPRLPDGTFALAPPPPTLPSMRSPSSSSIHYTVLMEPIASNVFFLAPRALSLEGNYSMLSTDKGGAYYDLDAEHPVARYEATSNLAQPPADALRAAATDYPSQVVSSGLQPTPVDLRVAQLAERVTAGLTNNYDRSAAIERYLATTFTYTLELPRTVPRDPIADFLFERKRGHCEYFASSMAIMLRTLRIPARVVNGFRTGEFNDLTGQYVVRAANAHSWVEAYFPGYGWIAFDPTPSAPPQARTGWSRFMLYADAMASFWREWIVNYDLGHQRVLGQELARNSRSMTDSLRLWFNLRYDAALRSARRAQRAISASPRRWSAAGVAATALLILLLSLRRIWHWIRARQLRAHPARAPRAAATLWYGRMLRTLSRRGWHKLPAQTPAEFVSLIEDPGLRGVVDRFTRGYEKARFAASGEDAEALPRLYAEVSDALRH